MYEQTLLKLKIIWPRHIYLLCLPCAIIIAQWIFTENSGFKAKRTRLDTAGAPKYNILKEQLEFFVKYRFTAPLMAETLQVSESTIRRRLR